MGGDPSNVSDNALVNFLLSLFNQRLTGRSPDNLEELREIAFDAEDDDEKEDNEDQEEQHEDKSDFDESQTSVEPDTEPSHDCDVPHKDDSTTEEC